MGKKKFVAAPVNPKIISLQMDATFFFERAVRSMDRYRFDKAIKYFRKAVDYEPENPVNHCNLAGILSEVGNYSESNQVLQRIVEEVDPSMTECFFYMANNYANMEDFEQAEKAIIHYLENDPEGHFLEESEEMMEFLSGELENPTEPSQIKCREGLFEHDKARSLLEQGQFTEAAQILKELAEKHPDFLAARNNLALAYYYMGQFARAMETVSAVLEQEEGNLHALCNLSIFYQHLGNREQLEPLVRLLKKIDPYHQEHVFKLATTMGILDEHEKAYRLFKRLLHSGCAEADPCLYHYTAVACCHTGRWLEAERHWLHVGKLDPKSAVAPFYLKQLAQRTKADGESPPAASTGSSRSYSYHYHLPFEEQFKTMPQEANELPDTIRRDPLVRSSFFWALRHGDDETKLQVIQAFGLIADKEVKEALREFLQEPDESDYLKKMAVFVLRSIGVCEPLPAVIDGEETVIPPSPYAPQLPEWEPAWQEVLQLAYGSMSKRYDLVQQHDLETLWIEFLSQVYLRKPRMQKREGWAAALEYWIAKMHRRAISYEEVAARYQTSVSTVRTCAKHIDAACRLKEKMDAIYQDTQK